MYLKDEINNITNTKTIEKYDASINSKSEMLMVWDRLTGGLIFVGGVVSIVTCHWNISNDVL